MILVQTGRMPHTRLTRFPPTHKRASENLVVVVWRATNTAPARPIRRSSDGFQTRITVIGKGRSRFDDCQTNDPAIAAGLKPVLPKRCENLVLEKRISRSDPQQIPAQPRESSYSERLISGGSNQRISSDRKCVAGDVTSQTRRTGWHHCRDSVCKTY
jgi:hypothetical protein